MPTESITKQFTVDPDTFERMLKEIEEAEKGPPLVVKRVDLEANARRINAMLDKKRGKK